MEMTNIVLVGRKIDQTGNAGCKVVWPCKAHTTADIEIVDDMIFSQDDKPVSDNKSQKNWHFSQLGAKNCMKGSEAENASTS